MGNRVSSDGDTRVLLVGGDYGPKSEVRFQNNRIVTSKYTLWNFLPKNLFEQFRRIANFYFLCMTVIALTIESPVEPLTSVLPLVFVIAVTALKQGYEDWLRHRSDNEVNCSLVTVIRKGIVQKIKAKDVHVGDLVRIVSDAEVPCDLVLLSSSDRDGRCYITTANLDGETNLKTLVCPRLLRNLSKPEQLARLNAQIECEQPTPDLYNFYGKIEIFSNKETTSQHTSVQSARTSQHAYIFGDIALQDTNLQNGDVSSHHERNESETSIRTSVVSGDMYTNHNRNSDFHRSRNPYSEQGDKSVVNRKTSVEYVEQAARRTSPNIAKEGCDESEITQHRFSSVSADPAVGKTRTDMDDFTILELSSNRTTIGAMPSARFNETKDTVIQRNTVIGNVPFDEDNYKISNSEFQRINVKRSVISNQGSDLESRLSTGHRDSLFENSTSSPLGTEHLLLRGARLKNTEFIIGCAVYTGQETKLALNSKLTSNKFSTVEKSINGFLIFFLCLLMIEVAVSLAFKYTIYNDDKTTVYLGEASAIKFSEVVQDLLSFLILYNYIIPISLYVTIETQKFIGSLFFKSDIELYCEKTNQPAICNTSDLNEELGQVEYLFTDKTGTLTENSMYFRRCSIAGIPYVEEGGKMLQLMADGDESNSVLVETINPEMDQFLLALALCHSVQVGMGDGHINNNTHDEPIAQLDYQASSPDEKALVEASARCGVVFLGEDGDSMSVKVKEKVCHYKKLNTLEFTSDRKRMSVIVQDEDGQIWLYCKGAESTVIPLTEAGPTNVTLQHVADFALRGLRTLVIGYKKLTVAEYSQLATQIERSRQTLSSRRVSVIAASYEKMESNLTLLGATGVEDQLQEGVQETLESLRAAGIKVWILTGDKVETAVNISFSCGHLKPSARQLYLTGHSSSETCYQTLKTHRAQVSRERQQHFGLIVDGQSLYFALNATEKHKEAFSEVCKACTAVICCRMSPLQKCQVVQLVKGFSEKPITAAIGDGANDVSMIQEAHVGLGIMGKEGRQAVRCSDFAFARFKFLRRVLLVHGHWYYLRVATLVQYFFYKNIVFITPQLYYGFSNCFSTEPLYNTIFLTCYNVLYTSLPILIYGLFEQNHSAQTLLKYPQLYRNIRQNILMSWSSFFKWITFGIGHSVVLYFIPWFIIQENQVFFTDNTSMEKAAFGTFIYHCVIFVVNFKLVLRSRYWTWLFLGSICITVFGFIAVTAIYSIIVTDAMHYVYPHMLGSILFWLMSLLLVVTCLIPDCAFSVLQIYIHTSCTKLKKKWKKIFGNKKRNHYSFNRSSFQRSSTMHTPRLSLASKRHSGVSSISTRRISGGC